MTEITAHIIVVPPACALAMFLLDWIIIGEEAREALSHSLRALVFVYTVIFVFFSSYFLIQLLS